MEPALLPAPPSSPPPAPPRPDIRVSEAPAAPATVLASFLDTRRLVTAAALRESSPPAVSRRSQRISSRCTRRARSLLQTAFADSGSPATRPPMPCESRDEPRLAVRGASGVGLRYVRRDGGGWLSGGRSRAGSLTMRWAESGPAWPAPPGDFRVLGPERRRRMAPDSGGPGRRVVLRSPKTPHKSRQAHRAAAAAVRSDTGAALRLPGPAAPWAERCAGGWAPTGCHLSLCKCASAADRTAGRLARQR